MSHNSSRKIAFNYFGGKYTWLDDIYANFPNPEQFTHLVDLFAGSMAVSINYPRKCIKTANDLNADITNFFEVLRREPEKLIGLLYLTPISNEEYNRCWDITEDRVEGARRFYVRVRQSFFGLGAQRKNKGWHMAKQHLNASGGETVSRWNNAIDKLLEVAMIIRENFQITNDDALAAIDKLDFDKCFIYCDPPYSKRSRASYNDYKFEFSDEQHEALADKLHNIEGLAMVSGYDCSLMNKLYKDWRKVEFKPKMNNIRSGMVKECIWMNYPEPKIDLFNQNL